MHENSGNSVIYYAHYTEDGVNKTGLTVTITVYEVIRDGTKTEVVTDGACTEIGDGLYRYLLASGTVDAAAEYVAVFHTATDTVDAQDIPAMWVIDRAGTEKLDTGITLADDAITADKFDESTAFPLKSADTGATQVARVGADSDTLETLSDEIAAVKAETALILADTGTDGVVLKSTQGAITWGQQKIIADADGEGALDIVNIGTGGGGVGIHTEGQFAGQFNEGAGGSSSGTFNIGVDYGLQNQGGYTGQRNYGGDLGVHNEGGYLGVVNEGGNSGVVNYGGDSGVRNEGDVQAVDGYDPALATASDLTTVDGKVDAIKLKTDNLPADPADDSDIDAQLAAIKAETASILEDTGTTIPATLATIDNEIAVIDGNVDSVLDDTGTSGVLLSTSALTSIFDDETVVGSYTMRDLLTIMSAALAGKLSGGGTTTLTFRSVDDTSDVIVTTVDANKNRTNVVITV